MSRRENFLVELGTEELPPKALLTLSEAFRDGLVTRLDAAGFRHGAVEAFATPRRLAVLVRKLDEYAAEQKIQRRGPPVTAAFDAAGQPTRAGLAFAQSCGAALDALGREKDAKGNEYLSYTGVKPGAAAVAMLPGFVGESLDALPIPKRMRWGAGEAQFVRPVHWLVLLYGREVIPATLLETQAGNMSRGHRYMAVKPLRITSPAAYSATLAKRGRVVASFAARRDSIRSGVTALAEGLQGRALIEDALLDEVTALVEWPVPLAGRFEDRFLQLPREVLISTLQDHQRYFPVEDAYGKLLPWFITVSNIESRDPQQVRAGNERVVRPRLSDAAFFWEQDRKQPLAARIAALDKVTFQAQLGSVGDKTRRVIALTRSIAAAIDADGASAARAALLAKCDLLTSLVGEFPELQGLMGSYYAKADGETDEVATAIAEHYLPRGPGDGLPGTRSGLAVSIADKLDTLAGIFAIGQKPTGTRDPFGLRRAAIGVLRMVVEKRLQLDLVALIEGAVHAQPVYGGVDGGGKTAPAADVAAAVYDYVMERLRAFYLEPADSNAALSGVTTESFDAVLATRPRSPLDFDARLRALLGFLGLPEAASLTAANKRIANLLKKSAGTDTGATTMDVGRLADGAERDLYLAVIAAGHSVPGKVAVGEYAAALNDLAQLRPAVDAFFDDVMVMDPDPALRANRLALLVTLRGLFAGIADLSRLPG
ncbi:MAG: glycine--tRNA ligase subunit beta [Pseudomonadota bacterium]